MYASNPQIANQQAEAELTAGAYAQAASTYRGLLLDGIMTSSLEKLHLQAKIAWCLLQTGQAKAVSSQLCCHHCSSKHCFVQLQLVLSLEALHQLAVHAN